MSVAINSPRAAACAPQLDLISVIGKPLELPAIDSPTPEQINHWHGKYAQALHDLFERHKGKYAHDPKAQLRIK